MEKNELIQLFGDKKVRTSWDPEQEKWYFSIVDICGVLTAFWLRLRPPFG